MFFWVELVPDDGMSLMDFVGLQFELEELFGRKVDLIWSSEK